jgi:hypothetical protein
MKSFINFITEDSRLEQLLEEIERIDLQEAATKAKEGEVSNNTKGVMHEILTGHYLNGEKHMSKHVNEHGETPEQTYKRLAPTVHPNDLKKMHAKAKSAAADIKAGIEKTHPGHQIVDVAHTSKPGDTEKVTGTKATQKQDSSDIYITTKDKKTGKVMHHGRSLKVSDNSSKNVPSSSLGAESSGEKAKAHHAKHKKEILKAYPQLAGKNSEQRKEIQKKNPKMQADIKVRNQKLLHKVAADHAKELQGHINAGNHEHVVNHIRELLHAHKTPAQKAGKATFAKHTTYETSKGTQHETSDPSKDYEHILKDHKNISVKSSGGGVHFYHNGKKFASQSHKFNSQSDPLSTLKSAGKAA